MQNLIEQNIERIANISGLDEFNIRYEPRGYGVPMWFVEFDKNTLEDFL